MTGDELGELLNAAAWAHRDQGYGLLRKPNGAHCRQPWTGKAISKDILMLAPDGRIFDCLIDAGGVSTPTWHEKAPINPALFVAPVDPTGIELPPVPPPPKPPPGGGTVDFPQAYPDENTWWHVTLREIGALYDQKGEAFNLDMFKWSARIGYSIGAGMEKERAKARHLAELRAALGL